MREPAACDIVIRNATVVDGTGASRRRGDVAISGDRIADVGDLSRLSGAREIDAGGQVLAPGFIDTHTHDDRFVLSDPDMAPKVSQGVTTVVTGNCGISLAPLRPKGALPPPLDLLGDETGYRFDSFARYLDALEAHPAAVNVVALVGHTTLRVGAMGALDREARDSEIKTMRDAIGEALVAGAAGMSTGLFYDPANAASTDEVIALAEVLAPADAIYATHMRDEAERIVEALDETLHIGRAAGVRVLVSHHKIQGEKNFGRTKETLARIDAARAGQGVAVDVYPYAAASTVLNPVSVSRSSSTVITWSKARPDAAGRTLADIAAEMGSDEAQAMERLQPAGAIYFAMDEDDVQRVLRHPGTMIGSDGLPHDEWPHPRLWGTFARVLGHYCRDLGLFSLEEAVHRMTGLAASEFALEKRGRIEAGFHGDLVLFDAETVRDEATFESPKRAARGIEIVIVNGVPVWERGRSTGERPGRVLRRRAGSNAAERPRRGGGS
ncbi:MAG: D-aminoacylase [Rhodospirillales bacterium]|jgi:N-acyl-D-amino-acid deacylase|nr:D-aminoacylase [Rhodospirillales bacterium]